MANSYSAPNFNIDSADVDVAALTALKGSAPASTDIIYYANEYTVNVDQDMDILYFYTGNNVAGNAATETGHLVVDAGVTLTIHDPTNPGGLRGEGATSTLTFGTDGGATCNVISNTLYAADNQYIPDCKITAYNTKFEKFKFFRIDTVAHYFKNVEFKDMSTAVRYRDITPELAGDIWINDCYSGFSSFTAAVDIEDAFLDANIKMTGGTVTTRFIAGVVGETQYMVAKFNDASIVDPPTFGGITGLTDNGDGSVTVSWNAGSHATGDPVLYKIYARNGSAPDVFDGASDYWVCVGTPHQTSLRISQFANGTAIANGDTVYVVVKGATLLSKEDSNTTAQNVQATVASGNISMYGTRLR